MVFVKYIVTFSILVIHYLVILLFFKRLTIFLEKISKFAECMIEMFLSFDNDFKIILK